MGSFDSLALFEKDNNMNLKCMLSMAVVAAATGTTCLAAEYFVDRQNGSDSYDGTASEWEGGESTVGPKQSIQAAVDLADGNGTIVTVLPGVYDNGGGESNDGSYIQANRVLVKKSNVTIRSSTGKPEDVHIVGQLSTEAGNNHGIGEGAMRCIANLSTASKIVVHGVTLRNGASITDSTRGGGVYASASGRITIIDCVVSNCAAARGGGAYQAIAHSSLFSENYAKTSYGAAICFGHAANCLLINNYGGAVLGYMYAVANCTAANNEGGNLSYGFSGGTRYICNTLSFGQSNNGTGGSKDNNISASIRCVIAGSGTFNIPDEDSAFGVDEREQCDTAFMDFHPLSTGACIGRGRGEELLRVPLPEGYTYHDMDRVPVPTSGAINVGAYQTARRPAASRIDFNCSVAIEGMPGIIHSGEWFHPTNWPVTYRFKSMNVTPYSLFVEEETLSGNPMRRFHMYDGWIPFTPKRELTATNTIGYARSRETFYADAENGSDAYDGTAVWEGGESLVGPKKTLQAAVDCVTESFGTVYAAPGIYDEGGKYANGTSNRVAITGTHVRLIASGGPGSATIVGAPDPDTGGLGPNATRCVLLDKVYSCVQGFVLTGGYSDQVDTDNANRGGAYYAPTTSPQILDCIVSNNVAMYGIGAGCTAYRTKFFNNLSTNYVLRTSTAASCLFAGNVLRASGAALASASCNLYLCTVDCNGYQNGAASANAYGNVFFNASAYEQFGTSVGNVICSPGCFADTAAHDYRLGSLAPACAAISPDDIATGVFHRYVTADHDGRAPLYGADGSIDAGAIQLSPKLPMYAVDGGGCTIEILGGGALSNCVTEATTLTAVATGAQKRPLIGFEINGEMQPLISTTQVFTASAETGAGTLVKAVYGTNWYVNATSGDDGALGSTAETARRTLKSVAQYAKSGDVIHAAAGTYNEGEMLHTSALYGGTPTVRSRVWVKNGVTLESESGPTNTFIVGSAATVEDRNQYNNGSNAVRCVCLGNGSTVRGFTLTGGHTGSLLQSDGTSARVDDCAGAAVLAAGSTVSFVEDCIITNNVAGLCAAGFGCAFNRCRIINNTGISRAAAGRSCRYYRSIINGNRGANQLEVYGAIDSCTVGQDAWTINGGTGASVVYNSSAMIVNSIVLAKIANTTDTKIRGTNCIFRTGGGIDVNYAAGCIVTNVEAIAFEDGFRPKIGANVGIDRADETLSNAERISSTDVYGQQGVMNGVRDLGAVEADWRPLYAADVGKKCTVEEVSPEVYETASHSVFLPTGSIAGKVGSASAGTMTYDVAVRVTGTGTLTLDLDGNTARTFTAAEGVQTARIPVTSLMDYSFAYTPGENDEGGAEILGLSRICGTMFTIR